MSGNVPSRRIVVLQPRHCNYFFQHCAERLAEAFALAGGRVTLATLAEGAEGEFDAGFVISLAATVNDAGAQGMECLKRIERHCGAFAAINLESMQTHWFAQDYQMFRRLGLKHLIDMNIHSQRIVPRDPEVTHSFLPYGLLPRERGAGRGFSCKRRAARPIPWTTVGFRTPERVQLLETLASQVDPRGIAYLSTLSPVLDDGHHLGPRQLGRLLERSVLYVWRSHHPFFYLEGERYRHAAIHGCVPVKVVDAPPEMAPDEPAVPFPYLILTWNQLATLTAPDRTAKLRERFLSEYLALPGLEDLVGITLQRIAPATKDRKEAA